MRRPLAWLRFRLFGTPMSHPVPDRRYEWLLTWFTVTWGVRCFLPGQQFSTSPSYAWLVPLAPEEVWGAGAITIALVRFAALLVNGSRQVTSPLIRAGSAGLSCLWWIIIASLIMRGAAGVPSAVMWQFLLICAEVAAIDSSIRDWVSAQQRAARLQVSR